MANIKGSALTIGLTLTRKLNTTQTLGKVDVQTNDCARTLDDANAPTVSEGDTFKVTMSGSTQTVDLTSLTSIDGRTVTLSGKAVRHLLLVADPGNNSGGLTVAKGASNGYTGLGSALSLTLLPSQRVAWDCVGAGANVDGTHKTLDLSGTTNDVLWVVVSAG